MSTASHADVLRRLAERYTEQLRVALGDRLVSVVLFGSVARGEASQGSDIDLYIVAEGLPTGHFARKRLLAGADAAFQSDLSDAEARGVEPRLARIVRTPEEAARVRPLYLDMTEDAVILHDKDGFFSTVLDRVRASLRRLGSKRVWLENGWYWDLKPDFKAGEIIEV